MNDLMVLRGRGARDRERGPWVGEGNLGRASPGLKVMLVGLGVVEGRWGGRKKRRDLRSCEEDEASSGLGNAEFFAIDNAVPDGVACRGELFDHCVKEFAVLTVEAGCFLHCDHTRFDSIEKIANAEKSGLVRLVVDTGYSMDRGERLTWGRDMEDIDLPITEFKAFRVFDEFVDGKTYTYSAFVFVIRCV